MLILLIVTFDSLGLNFDQRVSNCEIGYCLFQTYVLKRSGKYLQVAYYKCYKLYCF